MLKANLGYVLIIPCKQCFQEPRGSVVSGSVVDHNPSYNMEEMVLGEESFGVGVTVYFNDLNADKIVYQGETFAVVRETDIIVYEDE